VFVYVLLGLIMKGVFVMNTSLHDILFMTLDNDMRKHYHEIAVKQGLCNQVICEHH